MSIVTGDKEYFKGIGKIAYEGPESKNPLALDTIVVVQKEDSRV